MDYRHLFFINFLGLDILPFVYQQQQQHHYIKVVHESGLQNAILTLNSVEFVDKW